MGVQRNGRGSIWFSEIGAAINSVNNGIVCLTKENLTAPWILFEAGALARNFGSNRVCTFLIDVKPKDVSDPLAQFNHTLPTKESMFQLVKTLNERLEGSKLSDTMLQREFDLNWNLFESEFQKIMTETREGEKPPEKSEREILNDIVDLLQGVNRKVNAFADLPFMLQREYDFYFPRKKVTFDEAQRLATAKRLFDLLQNAPAKELMDSSDADKDDGDDNKT